MAVTGLITVNGKDVLEVDADPTTAGGIAASIGSLAMYDTGSAGYLFVKTGATDTDWTAVSTSNSADWTLSGNTLSGGSPTTPNEFFGSTNDYDNVFKRNNIELARLVSQGLLIGLNASVGGRLQIEGAALNSDIYREQAPNGGSGTKVIRVTRMIKVLTTDATDTTISDVLIPDDSVVLLGIDLVVRQTGGSSGSIGDGAVYKRDVHVKNIGGAATIKKEQTTFTSEDLSSMKATLSVTGANVRITAKGGTNRNFSWFGYVTLLIAGS